MPPIPNPTANEANKLVGIVLLTILAIEAADNVKADAANRNLTGILLPRAAQNRPARICANAQMLAVNAAEGVGNPRFI